MTEHHVHVPFFLFLFPGTQHNRRKAGVALTLALSKIVSPLIWFYNVGHGAAFKAPATLDELKDHIPTQTVLVGLGKRSDCLFIIQQLPRVFY
jgi:hypothetical protein